MHKQPNEAKHHFAPEIICTSTGMISLPGNPQKWILATLGVPSAKMRSAQKCILHWPMLADKLPQCSFGKWQENTTGTLMQWCYCLWKNEHLFNNMSLIEIDMHTLGTWLLADLACSYPWKLVFYQPSYQPHPEDLHQVCSWLDRLWGGRFSWYLSLP